MNKKNKIMPAIMIAAMISQATAISFASTSQLNFQTDSELLLNAYTENVISTEEVPGVDSEVPEDLIVGGKLTVITDENATSSFSSGLLNLKESQVVLITPTEGYFVEIIRVTSDGATQSLTQENNVLEVEDVFYSAVWHDTGAVTLIATGTECDVILSVATAKEEVVDPEIETFTIEASTDRYMTTSISSFEAEAGSDKVVTFTAKTGRMIDTIELTINGNSTTIEYGDSYALLEGEKYDIDWLSIQAAEITLPNISSDIELAGTSRIAEYSLVVYTDLNMESNVDSVIAEYNDSKAIILTPDSGYNISEVYITVNSKRVEVPINDGYVSLNGEKYSASLDLNGQVTIVVSDIKTDITIDAESKKDRYYILVDGLDYTTTSQEGVNLVKETDSIQVRFSPLTNIAIDGIEIETATGAYEADIDDDYIKVNGVKYELTYTSSGDFYVLIENPDVNMSITPISSKTQFSVTLETDSNCYTNNEEDDTIRTGKTYEATFSPKSGYVIEALEVTYGDATQTITIEDDDYITLNDEENPVYVDGYGNVTLTIHSVEDDLTISATATEGEVAQYKVYAYSDIYSRVTLNKVSPFYYGEEVNVKAYATTGYQLDTVTVSTDTDEVIIYTNTTRFVLDGQIYYVERDTSGAVLFTFDTLSSDVTIRSTSVADNSIVVLDSHTPYMTGYGSGIFGPDNLITRAEAVTTVNKLFFANFNASSITSNAFSDFSSASWYSAPINNAYQLGYLDSLIEENSLFSPEREMTRAELVVLLCNYSESPANNFAVGGSYSDVPSDYWAANAINYATANGWVCGFGDGLFNPDKAVTRAEAVVMINNFTGRVADKSYTENIFMDVPTTHWAYHYIVEATIPHDVIGYNADGSEIWDI